MSNYSAVTGRQTAIKQKQVSLLEFNALLNLFDRPALVFDSQQKSILAANTAFVTLTAFTSQDLQGALLEDHISGIDSEKFIEGTELLVEVKRRNRSPINAYLQSGSLDNLGQWRLMWLLDEEERSRPQRQATMFASLLELAKLEEHENFDSALKAALDAVIALFGVNIVAFYQADSNEPRLLQILSHDEGHVLPEKIESTDFNRLASLSTWIPGKRVQTELHRAARIANLSYTASVPLGEEGALMGLMVIAETERPLPEELLGVLPVIASMITGAMQHFILVTNLRNEITKREELVTVWSTLLDSAQEGILVLSEKSEIVEMNPMAEWTFGYSKGEVIGSPVENILVGPTRLAQAIYDAENGMPTHNMGDIKLLRRNGQVFPAHLQVIPVTQDDKTTSILIFINDISENEQIRAQAQHLEQRAVLGELTAILAHEVRNPVNGIFSALQLLESRLPEGDPSRNAISSGLNDCKRINDLIESVLAYARPMEPKFTDIDISMLLRRIVDRWLPRFMKVNVTSHFQCEDHLTHVAGDPRALEQVFTNLISNAVEAMSATGGNLSVKIMPNYSIPNLPQVEVAITDDGPGIPEDIREHLFEPFKTSRDKGNGLGLAITKRIVTAHKGTINAESFPGGTVFHVCLPANIEKGTES